MNDIETYLEELIGEFPICEYAFGNTDQIPFSDKIFTICQTDCRRYGHSWACPPNAGTIEDNIDRIGHYQRFLVFSTVWEVSDAFNFDACLLVRKEHEALTREFRKKLLDHYSLPMESLDENPTPPIYMLSAGCGTCEVCACPDEPCRYPKERLMSMESHGILIMKLVEDLGLTYAYDSTTVVYFSSVYF
ncbi:MAG: DUF2284 domain-containing protein [Lachnospiraceae bacterium]|nr:DUF2284 domain-containing protein [Lachnospiraceae bacterium]